MCGQLFRIRFRRNSQPDRRVHLYGAAVLIALLFGFSPSHGRRTGATDRGDAALQGWRWDVAPRPFLTIGDTGDLNEEFFLVRAILLMPDGRIVVGNGGTRELRFFDSEGRFLSSSGREGGGPGEFKSFWWMGRYRGDSIGVWDPRMPRISVFDSQGRYARGFRLDPLPGFLPKLIGSFDDGSLVATRGPNVDAMYASQTGLFTDSVTYLHFDAKGVLIDTLGPFAGAERFVLKNRSGGFSTAELFFGRELRAAVSRKVLYLGNTDAYNIQGLELGSRATASLTLAHDYIPVTDDDVRALRERDLASFDTEEQRRRRRQLLDRLPHRETMPAFAALVVDTLGNVWVEAARRPGHDDPSWTVFSPSGTVIATVATPVGLAIMQITDDAIWGIWRDEFDVEHVRAHRLIK